MKATHLTISLFTVLLLLIGCGKKAEESKDIAPIDTTEKIDKSNIETKDSVVIAMAGIDGKNALEVLKTSHEVSEVSSAMGTFVKGIDGIENDMTTFWFFSVNGEMADKAADNIITTATDSIYWYFRQVGAQTGSDEYDSVQYK
ncbi:MAG: DUF4430 domain-containing protein [Calditrichaeota bacterium]|nr:MAG: DUF4430 domain-containing protein [Calditrichota bacterium]